MTATAAHQLTIRLTCDDIPPLAYQGQATDLGLQNKQQQLETGAPVGDQSLEFIFQLAARLADSGAEYDFSGTYVHGPRAGRFVYIGYRPQGSAIWIRRWKIPLYEIPVGMLSAALERPEHVLSAQVSLMRSGTIRPIGAGWQL